MSEVVLFGASGSPFVKKVQRALALKKVGYREVAPSGPGDLRRWSPLTRKMPVLEIAGERVYDSTFILERLDADHPEPPLLSPDPATRAAQRVLEDWADEALYFRIMALRWSERNAAATLASITAGIPALVRPIAGALLRRTLSGQVQAQGTGRLPYDSVLRELGRSLDDLCALLGERPFFFADAPSIADLAVFGELEMGMDGPTPEVAELIGARPALVAHMERVRKATGG